MENNNSKIITLSFLIAGVLFGFVLSVLLGTAEAIATGSIARFLANDFVRHGSPVVLGAVLFFVLQFNKKVVTWADEVVTEIKRVVWPSRKDTVAMTIVVCVMLIISGLVLGLMDVVSSKAIDFLVHLNLGSIFS